VLSKPVSRSALILSKLAGNALGIFGVMGVLLGAATYGQIGLTTGVLLPVLPFAGMLGLLFLYQLFYLTLTIMLGTLFNNRGAVLGIPLVLIFGYQIMLGIAPWLGAIMPWNLVTTLAYPALALAIAQGNPLPTVIPLLATLAWCILFTLIAVWRFRQEEF
jgi:ABC-2 type transport system permease protein